MNNIYTLPDANVGSKFEKAAERRYQDGLDRDEARAAAIDLVHTELRVQMLAGMSGNLKSVASYAKNSAGEPRETMRSVIDAVLEAMDALQCAELLALVLAESECPIVGRLRIALAERYARDNCEEIAQARGLI